MKYILHTYLTKCRQSVKNVLNLDGQNKYFRLSENKTINVFPIDYIVQRSKVDESMSQ